MGFWQRLFSAGREQDEPVRRRTPRRLGRRDINPEPLTHQLRRIGGGLTPEIVSAYLSQADRGDIYHLIDLANECRQKDLHLQAILGAREDAVAGLDLGVFEPKDPTPKEVEVTAIVKEVLQALDANAGRMPGALSVGACLEHIQAANYYSFSCVEAQWGWDGRLLVPNALWPISHRRFMFRGSDGQLVQKDEWSSEVRNLLADYPEGKFLQHQPRITGDIPSREGLVRCLVWAALFRNWGLKDWMLLAELGWKPWRKGKYDKNADPEEIDAFMEALEQMSSTSFLVHTKDTEVEVIPTAKTGGAGGDSHKQLYQFLGREMSKAVLGASDVIEEGENGARSATEVRNNRFIEKIETDAVRDMRTFNAQLIAPLVRMNWGNAVRPPVAKLLTKNVIDFEKFCNGVEKLQKSKVPLSRSWVYDKIGGGEPTNEEDAIEIPIDEATGLPKEPADAA